MSVDKRCGVCGKLFIYNSQSIYKFGSYADRPSKVCCSYTCYMEELRIRERIKAERKEEAREKARKKSGKV